MMVRLGFDVPTGSARTFEDEHSVVVFGYGARVSIHTGTIGKRDCLRITIDPVEGEAFGLDIIEIAAHGTQARLIVAGRDEA